MQIETSPRLPLVAIEHYMLADDRPDYPMWAFLRLKLEGTLDREAFQRAANAAAAKNPLLWATIDESRGRRRYWQWNRPCAPAIFWNDVSTAADADVNRPLDLTREAGLRLKVDEQGDETVLLMQFHHCCCDGLGVLAFAHDLLSAYAADQAGGPVAQSGPAADRPAPALLGRLAERGRFGLGLIGLVLRAPLELLGLLGVLEFYSHRPRPLTGTAVAPPATARPDECSHRFTPEESRVLRAAAAAAGATLNDLLVRDMFLACGDWIVEREPEQRGKHVRVMVPVNLRTRRDGDISAANIVAMINLDRRPHRWRNLRRMLRVLHWEMTAVKRARLGITFIRCIQVLHYVFNLLPRTMPVDKCMATCVLSNVGDPWGRSPLAGPDGHLRAGSVTLRSIEVMPPIRPLTRAAIGVITYAGRLTVTLHYDRRALTRPEGEQLLATLIGRLNASALETSPVTSVGEPVA